MRERSLSEVLRDLGTELEEVAPSTKVLGAQIDSRAVRPGDIFFALEGESVHGADYAVSAVEQGAVAVVVDPDGAERLHDAVRRSSAVIVVVRDVAAALAQVAKHVRASEKDQVPAAAVTGSVGKTTTCRYAAELLAVAGCAHRPKASFNNHLGVPLTLLNAPAETDYLIAEVGTNAAGEVYRHSSWVRPEVVVVTAVAPAHLEGLRDLDQIAIEKLSILDAVEPGGTAWLPHDIAEKHRALLKSAEVDVKTFGPGGDLEIRSPHVMATEHVLRIRADGRRIPFEWRAPFPHSPRTLEAALAIGMSFGVDPERLLERVSYLSNPPLRGEVRSHAGVDFVLDCYNANPASVESAISRLEHEPTPGRRICVLGTMEELGEEERDWHRRLGSRLAEAKVDGVFLMGRGRDWYADGYEAGGGRNSSRRAERLDDERGSAERLAKVLAPGDRVLFKASRTERLEEFASRVGELLESQSKRPQRVPEPRGVSVE